MRFYTCLFLISFFVALPTAFSRPVFFSKNVKCSAEVLCLGPRGQTLFHGPMIYYGSEFKKGSPPYFNIVGNTDARALALMCASGSVTLADLNADPDCFGTFIK